MEKRLSALLSVCWLILGLMFALPSIAQEDARGGGGKPKHKPNPKPTPVCEIDGFSTTVTAVEELEGGCVKYTYVVSTDGTVRYDLSHYSVAIPCGTLQDITNSENWKQQIGTDPTTGVNGFKIDDIPSFGKISDDFFTVEFVICSDAQCTEPPTQVAYKAGQCIKYETLTYPEDDNGEEDGDDEGEDDDNGEDDDGDDDDDNDGGGGDGGGDDDENTCSTLLASITKKDITCNGQQNGEASVAIQDGAVPITYRWSTGAVSSSIQNLGAGDYSVTITDANGNTLTLSSQITEPEALMVTGEIYHPSCATSNGYINLNVSGGSGQYTFVWSNGATIQNLSNVFAGIYTVTVTDALGCSQQKSFQLINSVQLALSAITTKTTCGQATGSIDLTVTGGNVPYTFSWSNGASTEDIQNVTTGSYRVVVTDANGCQTMGNYFVQEINDIRITFQVTKSNCKNDPTGAIDITVTGGLAPFTYSWQHGPVTEDVTELVSGTYRVTVTDNTGCSSLATILVQRESLQINAQVIQPQCADGTTGSILLTPLNGTGPYTYQWSNGETDNLLVDVPLATYVVTVTDATGCSITLSYTLAAPAAMTANAVISNSACGSEGNYDVQIQVTGGKSPYQYLWSGGQTSASVLGLSTGDYEVQIKDASNCVITKSVSINSEEFRWTCTIAPPQETPVCNSAGNIITTAIADGDHYSWSVSSSDESWVITSGENAAIAIYNSGNPGSTASFTLTIERDGCIQTCDYIISNGCEVRDNTGGGDPGSGDPCAEQQAAPTVADVVEEEDSTEAAITEQTETLSAYPNPYESELNFEWTAKHDDFARLDIYDQQGRLVKQLFEGPIRKGEKYQVKWEDQVSRDCLLFYRYVSGNHVKRGKLLRR